MKLDQGRETRSRGRPPALAPAWNRGYILLPVVVAIAIVATITMLMNRDNSMGIALVAGTIESMRTDNLTRAALQHVLWQVNENGCGPHSDLATTAFGSHSYEATVVSNGGSGTATNYSVPVDQDTWLEQNAPTNNYGSDPQLKVKDHSNNAYQALYRFDVSAIPAGATVVSATAKFFVINVDDKGPVGIHAVTADWTEAGATWNSTAASYDPATVAFIDEDLPAGQFFEVEVASLVQSWVNGAANYGLVLLSISNNSPSEYTSKEYGNVSERPSMEVVTASGAIATQVTVTATVTMENGVTRMLTRDGVSLYAQPPVQLVLQPDAAKSADSQVFVSDPTTNYATDPTMEASPQHRVLLRFSLAALPALARIESAQLTMYMESNSGSDGNVSAYRLTSGWDAATVSWDDRTAADSWLTAGGDRDPDPVATIAVNGIAGWNSWDVTSVVQQWSGRTAEHHGLLFEKDSAGSAIYTSSEGASAINHPKLTISYSCGCAIVCVAPQGSGTVLLVVDDDVNLRPPDSSTKSQFESWGYTVNLISDNASQATFNTAVASNDVAYVTYTVAQGSLGNKLTAASIGVVHEQGYLNDELGISSSASWPPSEAEIDVVDASHEITSVFPTGRLRIRTTNAWMLTVSGSVAANAETLAQIGGVGALVVLESGMPMVGGGIAPNRRVMLPIAGYATNYWHNLNNNGQLLVQRAVQWALQGAAPVVTNQGDAFMDAAEPNAQKGIDSKLKLDNNNNREKQVVLRFGIALDPGTIIDSAILRLYVTKNTLTTTATVQAFALTETWDEPVVTWNDRSAGVPWTDAGGTYATPDVAAVALPKTLENAWFEMDITDLSQDWIDGIVPNHGVILISDQEQEVTFASHEDGNSSRRPQLIVTVP